MGFKNSLGTSIAFLKSSNKIKLLFSSLFEPMKK